LFGQARFPAFVDAPPFRLRLESWAARASFIGVVPLSRTFAIEGEIGGGVDVIRAETLSASFGASIAAPSLHAFPIARASLGVALSRLRVALRLTADLDPADRYVFVQDGAPVTLFSANVVRPGLALEIGTP
jgi:hypothetical protein